MSTPVRPSRMISPIFARFPWYSAIIGSVEDFLDMPDCSTQFKNFFDSLHRYESTLFTAITRNLQISSLRHNLGISLNAPQSSSGISQRLQIGMSTTEWSRMCSVISAYRLVDIVAMLGGATTAPSVERNSFQMTNDSFRGMDKLADWPKLLHDFQKLLGKSRTEVHTTELQGPQDHNGPFRLLQLIGRNNNTRSYTAIESNFLYAAMHLACMKDLRFSSETCPDIPDDLESLIRMNPLYEENKEDLEDLRSIVTDLSIRNKSTPGVSYLRAPLHLALLISPLFLLLPIQLFKKSYNRQTMLSISACLGNRKPQILLDVEMAIWTTLFSLASGVVEPLGLLQQFSDGLPWERIQLASSVESERSWFNIRSIGSSVASIPPSAPTAHDVREVDQVNIRSIGPVVQSMLSSAPHVDRGVVAEMTDHDDPMDPLDDPDNTDYPRFDPPMDCGADEDSAPSNNVHTGLDSSMDAALSNTTNERDDMEPDDDIPQAKVDKLGDVDDAGGSRRDTVGDVGADDSDEDPEASDKDPEASDKDAEASDKDADDSNEDADDNDKSPDDSDEDDEEQNAVGLGEGPDAADEDSNGDMGNAEDDSPDSSSDEDGGNDPEADNVANRPPKRRRIDSDDEGDGHSTEANKTLSNPIDGHPTEVNKTSGSRASPIDVDLHISVWEPTVKSEDTSFLGTRTSRRVKGAKQLRAFDADGVEYKFTPEFHFDRSRIQLSQFFGRIEDTYRDGKPLHIVAPEESRFEVISFVDFQALSPPQIHDRLRRKHVVVTGCPHSTMKFDGAGLRTLCPLDNTVSIQDHSIRNAQGSPPVTVSGNFKDILDNATSTGKILNGLDFPMWKDPEWHRSSYATDMVAWDYLRGKPHCGTGTTPYPTGHVRWGLAGTAHTITSLHVDSDGFATFVQVMCGLKVWTVYRTPKSPVSTIHSFVDSTSFQLDKIPPKAQFGLEAVVLRPGDLLLMQPGTPHFVYGIENTIVHGGHFYSSSLMQSTLTGLIHTFVLSDFISNTFHPPSRQLLRNIILFWGFGLLEKRINPEDDEYSHLPDVRTIRGLLDLISGCTLAILGNVLDFRTYSAANQGEADQTTKIQQQLWKQFDRNNIPGDERLAICYVRGVALAIFGWIRRCCIIKSPDGTILKDLPSKYVVHVLDALGMYKRLADNSKLSGAPHCTFWKLNVQAVNVVTCDPAIEKVWDETLGAKPRISPVDLLLTVDEGCVVEWKEEAPLSLEKSRTLYEQAGITCLDRKFLDGEHRRTELEAQVHDIHKPRRK